MIRLPLYLVLFVFLILLFTGCKNDSESLYSSLDTVWVNKVYEQEGMIYAATEKGVWKKHSVDTDLEWESIGLYKHEILDIEFLGKDKILAGINIRYADKGEVSLYLTENGGESWFGYLNNYGGTGGYTSVKTLVALPDSDTIFATGPPYVARSVDSGKKWETVYLDWDFLGKGRILEVDKKNTSKIWTGGSNTAGVASLSFSTDRGENWERIDVFGLSDNVCWALTIHPSNAEQVMVGMDSFITDIDSENKTIDTLLAAPAYFRSLEASPSDPQTVYAGPQDGGSLKFYKTTDWGQHWQTIEHPDGFEADVIDVLVTDHAGEDVIYLATTKGVFSYSNGTFNRF